MQRQRGDRHDLHERDAHAARNDEELCERPRSITQNAEHGGSAGDERNTERREHDASRPRNRFRGTQTSGTNRGGFNAGTDDEGCAAR